VRGAENLTKLDPAADVSSMRRRRRGIPELARSTR
jgi:hypothetical protein